MSYLAVIDHRIDGIPAKIGVTRYRVVPPWRGDPVSCPSDLDYRGYTVIEWDTLDSDGRPAAWLDAKRTPDTDIAIEQTIADYFSEDQ